MQIRIFFLTVVFSLVGCADRYDEGYEAGYEDGYVAFKPTPIIAPIPSTNSTHTIQDLFIYNNFASTVSLEGFSFRLTGEITNNTGVEHSLAKFEITFYNHSRRIIDTEQIHIFDFKDGTTRFFDELILTPIEEVKYYTIKFISG